MVTAVKTIQTKHNFNSICNEALSGDIVFVPVSNNEKIVVLSEKNFIAMQNANYIAMLDKSVNAVNRGEFISKTIDELMAYE